MSRQAEVRRDEMDLQGYTSSHSPEVERDLGWPQVPGKDPTVLFLRNTHMASVICFNLL